MSISGHDVNVYGSNMFICQRQKMYIVVIRELFSIQVAKEAHLLRPP